MGGSPPAGERLSGLLPRPFGSVGRTVTDIGWLDATAQAALVRSGEISPVELVESAIGRSEKLNPEINAIIHPRYEKARTEAAAKELPDGPFRGVPIVIKDLTCHQAGEPYHAGMKALRDRGFVAERDSHLWERLREAGFVSIGRTNVPEIGLLPTTEPEAYGATRNPWDVTRSTGGSSGGSAAAVAAGIVSVGHGNDGGGSIRIPASECGLFGLKPSRGRVSFGPYFGETWGGLECEGVITRSVRDTAAILDIIAGRMPGDPYTAPPPARPFRAEAGADPGRLRIGLTTRAPGNFVQPHPDVVAAVEDAGRLLESLGHCVEPAEPPGLDIDFMEAIQSYSSVVYSSCAWEVDLLARRAGTPIAPEELEPPTRLVYESAQAVTGPQYVAALEWGRALARDIAAWWTGGWDLLLTPVIAEPPPPLGSLVSPPDNPLMTHLRAAQIAPYTAAFNLTGQPGMSVPLLWNSEGLPTGVHLVADYGREDLLIRLAAQLEQARPWADRRPPLSA